MKFSVHNKLKGGFDYYEAADTVPVNDDHPSPRLASHRTKMGVPATLAGRPLPKGARASGHGQYPVGSVSSGKPGSWLGGSGLPSGLGLGGVDVPCPQPREAAVVGVALGAILHIGTGSKQENIPRGLAFLAAGGLAGYLLGERVCFWR
jgi:hypothetical protein